jgi:hypothetical protein
MEALLGSQAAQHDGTGLGRQGRISFTLHDFYYSFHRLQESETRQLNAYTRQSHKSF